MRKNEDGRLEMYPIPTVRNGDILIIGESVNITELKENRYFISSGADVLNTTLANCGIPSDVCVYTVAIPFILNKIKTVTQEQFKKNHDRLWDEIKKSGVKYVMPMGTLATQLLLGDKVSTITKLVGNVIHRNDVTIVPNYHPAMMYHKPAEYKIFTRIIDNIGKLYRGYNHNPGETRWTVIDTLDKLNDLIELVKVSHYVVADIETSSLKVWDADIWVMGITLNKNHTYVIVREVIMAYQSEINSLLLYSKWVWHNGKYDISVLHWNDFNSARIDEDTILLHYCLNENTSHTLGACSTIYLGADEYKSDMNSEFANINTQEDYLKYKDRLIERVAIDCDYTYQLFNIFRPMVYKDKELNKLYEDILIPGTNFLTEVQKRGVMIDIDYLKSRVPFYNNKIKELIYEIQEEVKPDWNTERYVKESKAKSIPTEFNPSSQKQVSWLVWKSLGLVPKLRCKVGSTGAEILESIPNRPKVLDLILDLRKINKEYSTYVKNYLKQVDDVNILHCTFNLHTTATGRLSCTQENIQNVPSKGKQGKDIRRAFIPRLPGRILMEVDYSGAELRVLAFVSQDERMIKAVTEGDLHSEVAESIFGKGFTKEQRGMAKTVNFGIAYGRTGSAIDEAFELPKGEGDKMIDIWSKTYPKAWEYLEGCIDSVKQGEVLTTPFGRKRRFGLVSKQSLQALSNEAKNFRIQSISSDNTLIAAMKVDEILQITYDALIVNLIHDSILIDLPNNYHTVKDVSKLMVATMMSIPKDYYNCNVEFKCDVDIGFDWGHVSGLDFENMIIDNKPYEEWIKEKQYE